MLATPPISSLKNFWKLILLKKTQKVQIKCFSIVSFKNFILKKKLFLVFLGPRKIHFPSKLIIFQLASLDTMVMPKSSEWKIFVSGKIVNKILFTDFYLGLGRVCKTLFILNTFLGSYISNILRPFDENTFIMYLFLKASNHMIYDRGKEILRRQG